MRAPASWRRRRLRAIDIDVIFTSWLRWPAWRGGPMFWADRMGLKAVRDKLAHYAQLTGDPNLKPARADREARSRGRLLRRDRPEKAA
jgi:3-hydroxyacyl-CoA dehydrogenase